MRAFSLFFLSSFCLQLTAQVPTRTYVADEKRVPREHNVDFQHMLLKVDFEPEKGVVNGNVQHTFKVLQKEIDSVVVDGINIEIKKALLDGKEVEVKNDNEHITFHFVNKLHWNTTHKLEIDYTAKPTKGIYFVGWKDKTDRSRKQIWTQGQGIDNRNWIPFYDEMNDKITSEIVVEFDSKYRVLSNGEKLSEKPNKTNGKTYWRYKMKHPHAPYLVMLGIGEYDIKSIQSKGGVNIDLWYYPDWANRVEPTYKYSAEMMDFFEEEIGVKYPWEGYSQVPVQDFMYGAMENTTATIFGDFFMVDERGYLDINYVYVNAHELAHQWFGDFVTARSSTHHWLQESFATYYNYMYEKEAFGQDHYDWKIRDARNSALKATEKDFRPVASGNAGGARYYPKGAHVLHMLKYVLGREQYNAGIRHYLNKHQYGNVDTEDLLVAFHETLGMSLDWFWEQWLYTGGEPKYDISYEQVTIKGKRVAQFNVEQVHTTNEVVGLFKMPIVFELAYTDGTVSSEKRWIEKKNHLVQIPIEEGKDVSFALFDPNSNILKDYTFNKNLEMLENQLLNAKNMIDRYDAAKALNVFSMEDKREVLTKAFKRKDEFHFVKVEIIKQLIEDEQSAGVIKMALEDGDSEVRKGVVTNTVIIQEELRQAYENLLTDSSYYVLDKALTKLCFSFPEHARRYLDVTKGELGNSGRHIRIKWLEMAYLFDGANTKKHVDELVDYTSVSFEFRTRMGAAKALKRLNYFDAQLLEHLCDGILNPNKRLSDGMKEVLTYFYAQTSYAREIYDHINSKYSEDDATVLSDALKQ